jgi:hypothetical protein
MELARTKKELAEVKMERNILTQIMHQALGLAFLVADGNASSHFGGSLV